MPLETPLLELHRSSGATIGEYFGTLLPARFGEFAAEYAALREAVALVDTNYRAFFSFTGPDRHRYLNAMLTSNVRDLKPGQGTVGLLLNPQGHILAEVETFALEESILASRHAMVRERTFATFDKFIIMDDVTLEDVTASTGTLDLAGPRARELLADLGVGNFAEMPLLSHEEVTLGQFPAAIVRRELAGDPAATLIVAREHLAAFVARACSARAQSWRRARRDGSSQLHSAGMRDALVRHRLRRQANSARGGAGALTHQLRERMLHRPGNRRAGALARPRQPAAHGVAVFRR